MTKKLVIFGLSNIAECAYEYFTHDSDYVVSAFTLDRAYIKTDASEHLGLPVVAFEDVATLFPPQEYEMFIAVGAQQLNRLRTQKMLEAKHKGYRLASYISSHAFIWRNVTLGEHVFIQENNTCQPFVVIGNNVTLWAGNHIGHATVIEDNCFIASHVVISGHCRIKQNSFIGVNATIAETRVVGSDNFIGMNVNIAHDTKDEAVYKPAKSELTRLNSKRLHRVTDD